MVAGLSIASFFGFEAMVAVLAASIAVILPELMYALIVGRILRSQDTGTSKLAQAVRARLLKIATTVAFLAVSLGAIGTGLVEVAFWVVTVIVAVLLPGWTQMIGATAARKR